MKAQIQLSIKDQLPFPNEFVISRQCADQLLFDSLTGKIFFNAAMILCSLQRQLYLDDPWGSTTLPIQ